MVYSRGIGIFASFAGNSAASTQIWLVYYVLLLLLSIYRVRLTTKLAISPHSPFAHLHLDFAPWACFLF